MEGFKRKAEDKNYRFMNEQNQIKIEKSRNKYWKFVLGFFGIIILSGAGYFVLRFYFRNEEFIKKQKQDQEIIEHYAALEKKIKEDVYGGETPEETLRLFIDALKAGDTDLAAKYFVVEKQEEQKQYLQEIKQQDNFRMAITDLVKLKLSKQTEGEAFYTAVGSSGVVELQVIFSKNLATKKWKILEL